MKKYLVVIEKTDTGYSAYSPDLPGCISTGASREERSNAICRKRSTFIWMDCGVADFPFPSRRAILATWKFPRS